MEIPVPAIFISVGILAGGKLINVYGICFFLWGKTYPAKLWNFMGKTCFAKLAKSVSFFLPIFEIIRKNKNNLTDRILKIVI